ncbi:WecB/TagA/CpsF family glycosyl transferase [[Clostridium] cellulosi]|uniref:WecB/TagA/CpsF family glycosyl transferase n=2 Tax=Bacteria TaxID=2 RepID=A0A078KNU1_9FIRM|nr:MAG: glycosyltransferase [[Clostridium] cellulosi]CDZ24143.1 WecB/TagA/CpsF family glycosyl transferase [[Clostridium] cellulosi]
MEKCNILGIQYDNTTVAKAAKDIYEFACSNARGYVVTPNAEIAETCFKNKELKTAVENADFILPDGAGVIMASKILGRPLKCRVTGVDTAKELLLIMSKTRKRLYLLGAKPGVSERAAENISAMYPGIVIAGTHHGYFKDDEEVISLINNADPDIVFVALGYPRQEIFMYNNYKRVNAVMMGIGGGVDIFAGEAKRAPDFFINHNLEWFYRLLKQPTRIGRMMKLPAYIIRAVFWKITSRKE